MNTVVKMHHHEGKLPKSDYRRLNSDKRVEGIDKNSEGQEMARALFIREKHRAPKNIAEVKDFHKRETKGHSYAIGEVYWSTIGEVSPYVATDQLEASLPTSSSSLSTLSEAITSGNLTCHVRASYEDFLDGKLQEPLEVYKVSLN